MFFHTDWKDSDAQRLASKFSIPTKKVIDFKEYTIYDNTPAGNQGIDSIRHLILVDNSTNDFIIGKVARRQCEECMGGNKGWDKVREILKKMLKVKPNVGRGVSNGSVNEAYKIFGYRKDPLSSRIGEYTFKKGVDVELQEDLIEGIAKLCFDLETASSRIGNGLVESREYKEVKDFTKTPSVAGRNGKREQEKFATAFSIGRNYWSKSHVDKDFYFTTLSVVVPNRKDHREIAYYFVFPQYKIAIPLRSGDIILFNPLLTHSCSNPRFEGTFIFSAYVANKTVLTQAVNTFKESELIG